MIDYPAIVSQLAPNSKGIIHMEVGTYFESFDKKDEAALEAADDGASLEAEPEGTEQNENEDER
ncbi:hypothetical protein MGI18_12150 [Bacillus sp. OVS6]|nr:hypothetical protein MGI18_12150 [Bacillus sp. OVS6]